MTSSASLSSSSASSPSPASPRASAPWWQTCSPWGQESRVRTWQSGRMSTSRAQAVRCTRRLSHPPSPAWPSLRPQSKVCPSSLSLSHLLVADFASSSSSSSCWPWRWDLMTGLTPRSPSTPGAPRYQLTLSASSLPSLRRRWRGETFDWQEHPASVCCRAWYYCKACHEDVKNENQIKKCKCKNCKYNNNSVTFNKWKLPIYRNDVNIICSSSTP